VIEQIKKYNILESKNTLKESLYGQPDVIWTHPKTGGKVFVGDISSAN